MLETYDIILDSPIFQKTIKMVEEKGLDYQVVESRNDVLLIVEDDYHHDYLFYTSKQNINHIFRCRIFGWNNINSRIVGNRSRNLNHVGDKDVVVHRDEKVITYRNTDIGNTDNINRVEKTTETLGYPFKRRITYGMMIDGKDRLQYRRECKELHTYNKKGERKKLLDDTFCSRVYNLFLRFKGMERNYERRDKMRQEKYISGRRVLELMKYLYSAMSSYNPFFYHDNGLSKLNKYWLEDCISRIERFGLLDKKYRLGRLTRSKHVDKNNIKKPKDIRKWRIEHNRKVEAGEIPESIEQ